MTTTTNNAARTLVALAKANLDLVELDALIATLSPAAVAALSKALRNLALYTKLVLVAPDLEGWKGWATAKRVRTAIDGAIGS